LVFVPDKLPVAPLAKMVRPLPVMFPPVQFKEPLIVKSPLPVSVPLVKERLGRLCGALKTTVAELIVALTAGIEFAIVIVPLLKFTVPVGTN
jgi:hypothetical protein